MSKKELTDIHCENMPPGSFIPHTPEFKDGWEVRVSFEAGYDSRQSEIDVKNKAIAKARAEAYEEAATIAFEKIRCDDRTDRWQVANEVAAHIRARAAREKE